MFSIRNIKIGLSFVVRIGESINDNLVNKNRYNLKNGI